MRLFKGITAFLILLTTVVAVSWVAIFIVNIGNSQTDWPYDEVDALKTVRWRSALKKGGPEVNLNGTIQSIERQIRAIKPDWNLTTWKREMGMSDEVYPRTDLAKRNHDQTYCGSLLANRYNAANKWDVRRAANTLVAFGMPGCHIPGRGCFLLSCVQNGAVWLCNDEAGPVGPPCDRLGSLLLEIIDNDDRFHCLEDGGMNIRAQRFDPHFGLWNVIGAQVKEHCSMWDF